MKNKKLQIGLLMLMASIQAVVSAAEPAEANEGAVTFSGISEKKFDFHNPLPWLEIGADARLRIIREEARKLDKNNNSDNRLWQRYRGRVWSLMKFSDDLNFNMRLVTEPRYESLRDDLEHRFYRQEALFDWFNIEMKNILGLPLKAKIGRQELLIGSSWLILDGTPLDGSRTFYFDAARFTYDLDELGSTLDLVWIDNHANGSKWLKPINDQDLDIAEQDERGLIVYLSDKLNKKTQIDCYFIYKNDYDRNRSSGTEGNIYTFGSMFKSSFGDNWGYQIEIAPQFGHKNGKELSAFGSNNKFTYRSHDEKDNTFLIGYEYLSGNKDPGKHFDRVWARESRYSDLYNGCIDSIDGRDLDGTNLHRPNFGWYFKPIDKMQFLAEYSLMFADKNTIAAGTNGMSEHGKFRGQLIKLKLNYAFTRHVQNAFTTELFFPGNFYNDDRNDVAMFFQYEVAFFW